LLLDGVHIFFVTEKLARLNQKSESSQFKHIYDLRKLTHGKMSKYIYLSKSWCMCAFRLMYILAKASSVTNIFKLYLPFSKKKHEMQCCAFYNSTLPTTENLLQRAFFNCFDVELRKTVNLGQ
jgi:hypothetical protein